MSIRFLKILSMHTCFFFQLCVTCTLCVRSSSFQETLLLGSNPKNGEYHPNRMFSVCMYEYFYPFQSSFYPNKSLYIKLVHNILCIDFLFGLFMWTLVHFDFISGLRPGSYRDLNPELGLSSVLCCWAEHLWYTCSGRLSLSWHTLQGWSGCMHCRKKSNLWHWKDTFGLFEKFSIICLKTEHKI